MSDFLKPQSPLQHKDGAYIYPLTTADQVILEDNSRLNTAFENLVYVSEENQETAIVPLDADTLNGQLPNYYAPATKLTPRNLLVNSDFTNPVNQRGVTSYVSEQYGIDRWVCGLSTFTATVQSDGIHLGGSSGGFWLRQHISMGGAVKIGANFTLAVKKKNTEPLVAVLTVPAVGTVVYKDVALYNRLTLKTASDGSYITFEYFGNKANEEYIVEWAALYEGEYTAETLPEYQPKGYETELLICRQYDPTTGEYIGLRKFGQHHNLLDNSDFTNPVNQRGLSSYSGEFIYTIDRWQSGVWQFGDGSGTIELLSDGIKLSSGTGAVPPFIFQRLEKLPIGTYTFAAKFKNNTGIATLSNVRTDRGEVAAPSSTDSEGILILTFYNGSELNSDNAFFRLDGTTNETTVVWEWAALYEGEYTLDTLPEYQPKGYAAELAECQRYYLGTSVANAGLSWVGYCHSETEARFTIPTIGQMRVIPTVKFGDISLLRIYNNGNAAVPTVINGVSIGANSVVIRLASTGLLVGQTCSLKVNTTFDISADL